VEVQGGVCQGLESLPALLHKTPAVQGVGIHHRHMGENRPVFFFTVGKAEHPSYVEFLIMKVGVHPVAADFPPWEIVSMLACTRRFFLSVGRPALMATIWTGRVMLPLPG